MPFNQPRSMVQVINDGVRLYGRYWWRLTQPLVAPVGFQLVGVGLWLGLAYQSISLLTQFAPHLHPWLMWVVFLVANVPGVALFLHGFWEYMLWTSAINLVIRDLADTGQTQANADYLLRVQHRATDYSILWLLLFALSCIPLVFAALPTPWLNVAHLSMQAWAVIGVFCVLGMAVAGFIMYSGVFIFQGFVFAPGPSSKVWGRSWALVKRAPYQTMVVGSLAILAVQLVLPYACLAICDVIHFSAWLGQGLTGAVQYVATQTLASIQPLAMHEPTIAHIMFTLFHHPPTLALEIAQTLILTIAAAFLLPLGACWLTLLYGSLDEKP